ncbi:MAG: hypothetical protein AB1304_08050 [Bacteroidota bacterium]
MKYSLQCILLLLISLTNYWGQKDSALFSKIDAYLKEKNWLALGLLYEQLSYSTDSIDLSDKYKCISAEFFKQAKDYNTSINLLKSIYLYRYNDSLKFYIKYQIALNYYLSDDLISAKSEIISLHYLLSDSTYIYRSYPLFSLILNELYEWEKAKQILISYNNFKYKNDTLTLKNINNFIDSLYNKNHLPKIKSIDKAIALSTFFPGLGQMYSKNYSEGIITMMSHIFIIGLSTLGIYYQYYFTSIIAGSSLFAKFYNGNLKRAEFSVKKYNYMSSKNFNQNLKNLIINEYYKK